MVDPVKVTLTGEDKTAAAFSSATKNAQALTKELEKQAGVNESMARALQKRAKDTNKSYDDMLRWSIAAQKQNEDYWRTHRAGSQQVVSDNQRQATAIKGVGAELVSMAKGYLTVTGAIEAARRSFLGFAETEKKMLLLQNQTKATSAEIKKFEVQIKQTSQDTATDFDESLAAANRLRTGLNITMEEAVRRLPRLNIVAQGMGVGVEQLAKLTTGMMRNLNIPANQFGQALEIISASARDANVDVKDLVQNGTEVAEVAKQIGYHGLNGLARVQTLIGVATNITDDTSNAARLVQQTLQSLESESMGAAFGRTPGVWKKELDDVKAKEGDVSGYVVGLLKNRRDQKSITDKMDVKQRLFINKLIEDDNGKIGQTIKLLKDQANGTQAIKDGMNVLAGSSSGVDAMKVSIKGLADEFGNLLAQLGVPQVIIIFTEKLRALGDSIKYVAEWIAYAKGEGPRPEINIIGPHGLTMPTPKSVGEGMMGKHELEVGKKRLEETLKNENVPAPAPARPAYGPGSTAPRTGPGAPLGAAPGTPGYQPSSYQGGYRGYGGAADSAYIPADFRNAAGGGLLHRASLGGGGSGGGGSQYSPAGPGMTGTGYGGGGGAMLPAAPGGGGGGQPGTPGVGAARGRVGKGGDPRGMEEHIRATAVKYGIDPDTAVAVAKSEGLSTFQSSVKRGGKGSYQGREDSWGAFQLYMGGGLGNQFQKETGLDPRDPANEKAGIDFALKHASKKGWGSWYGARNTGIGNFAGIGGNAGVGSERGRVARAPAETSVDTVARGERVARPGEGGGDRVQAGRDLRGTDPRLTEIVGAAARGLPPGYTVAPTSGRRTAGQGQHTHGLAQDWQIIDPSGKPVPNRGDDKSGLYTTLARNAYGYQEKYHPQMTGKFQWGGQFGTSARNPDEPDLMHFDFGGRRGRIGRYSREAIGSALPPPADAPPSAVAADEPKGEGAIQQREREGSREEQINVKMRVNDNDMQFARSSMRTQADREVREARWNSYSDIGAA